MSKRKIYGQKAAVALKYNPSLNYAPVVVASGLKRERGPDRSSLRTQLLAAEEE